MQAVHTSPFAGTWYPEERRQLERLLDEKLERSLERTGPFLLGNGIGFVTPHAAPEWSGSVAAAVYRSLRRMAPERVVLLAFPHHGRLRGVATPHADAIRTPLGDLAVDCEYAQGFDRVPECEVCDHSFEIQIPFLQRAAPNARVTPIYTGRLSAAERKIAAARLAALWRPGVVFVASSDFTHYGRGFGFAPFPCDERAPERLFELDSDCIEAAGSVDSRLFLKTLEDNGATVCGTGPIALLLDTIAMLRGDVYQEVLDYQTSGEISGEYDMSVSYAALGYYGREAFELESADCDALLASACETLQHARETGLRTVVPAKGGSAALQGARGVFVSLHRDGELLGCVGNTTGVGPLRTQVGALTLAAAFDDPRFDSAEAMKGPVDVEISVLTPAKRIGGADRFVVGRHGAMLRCGGHAGLLLPQVAEGRGWSGEDFLEAVGRKALLGKGAWRGGKVSVFEAQIFARRG